MGKVTRFDDISDENLRRELEVIQAMARASEGADEPILLPDAETMAAAKRALPLFRKLLGAPGRSTPLETLAHLSGQRQKEGAEQVRALLQHPVKRTATVHVEDICMLSGRRVNVGVFVEPSDRIMIIVTRWQDSHGNTRIALALHDQVVAQWPILHDGTLKSWIGTMADLLLIEGQRTICLEERPLG